MHLQEKLRLLQQAGGDTANLVLASVDLAYYGLPETQLAEIREALEACSIPHWCDEQLLATLLDISVKDSKARLSKLRRLGTIERFTARGFSAVNVAEPGRTAIRTRMSTNDPKRFSLLSLKAAKHFGKETSTAGRIESIFNLLSASQREAQKGLGAIIKKLTRDGRYQELHLLYKTA